MKKSVGKVVSSVVAATMMLSLFSGCGKEKENVTLSVWGAEEDQEMLNEMVDAFEEKYKDEAEFNITICVENEVTCKETVLIDPKKAADIYAFADDQLASAVMNLDIQMEHEIVKKLREEMKTT